MSKKPGDIPNYFVYGEAPRPIDVGFVHVETVMARRQLHYGHVTPHIHEELAQITLWTTGSGTYSIEDRDLHFFAPAVSFMPTNVVHGFRVEPGTDAVVVSIAEGALWGIADDTILPLNAPLMLVGKGWDPRWKRLRRYVDLIQEEYAADEPGMEKVTLSLIAVALSQIARLTADSPALTERPELHLASQLRRQVEAHFREEWRIERYIAEIGTTPHLLAKASQAVFGKGVKTLISERRILEAKRLLRFTVRSVESIAYEVGFRDAAYFSRFFRERTGLSPSDWRTGRTPPH